MRLSLSACHARPWLPRNRPFSHSRVPPRLAAPLFSNNQGVWKQHGRTRHASIGQRALQNSESSPSSLEIAPGEEREAYEEYVETFQEAFGIPGTVDFGMGRDGYPCMRLRHPKGSSLEVSLAGAHIPSWTNHAGEEMLYQRDESQKRKIPERRGQGKKLTLRQGPEVRKAPLGGISLAWPQWGDASHWPPGEHRSGMPFDGFLRVLPWTPVHADVQRAHERHDPVSWVEEEEMEEDGSLWEEEEEEDDDDSNEHSRRHLEEIREHEDVRVLAVLRASSDDLGASDHPGLSAMPYRFEALYSVGLATPEPDPQVDPDKRQEWDLLRTQHGFTPEQRERHSLTGANKEEPEPIEPPEELQRREEEKLAREKGILCYSGERVSEPPEPPPEPIQTATHTDEEENDQEEEGPEFGSEPSPSQELWLSLSILNKGDCPLRFSTGLRTRFATEDIAERQRFVKTVGLRGKYSLRRDGDDGGPPRVRQDNEHELTFEPEREIDRIYIDCGDKEFIALCPGWPMHFEMRNEEGFNDIGVLHSADPADARWNAGLSPARVARPVTLQPGEVWTGTARIIAHHDYWDLLPWEQAAGKNITEIVPPLRVKTLLDPEYWWKHMVY